jgi:hypothetical protein
VTRAETATRYQLGTAARVNSRAWGLGLGLLCGFGLLVATDILVLKGGKVVGPHLALLGNYLPGYRVSFGGGLVGFGYGLLIGYFSGRLIGSIYNFLAPHAFGAGDEKARSESRRSNE